MNDKDKSASHQGPLPDRRAFDSFERALTLSDVENDRLSARGAELRRYQQMVAAQEKEFADLRAKLKEEQLFREKEFLQETTKREKMFASREREFSDQRRRFEEEARRSREEFEALRQSFQAAMAEREFSLQAAQIELQKERERYSQQGLENISKTSADYVSEALTVLESREADFHKLSKHWSVFGTLVLAIGALIFAAIAFAQKIDPSMAITWEYITFVVLKGLVVVAIAGGLARHAFSLSNYYMQESLKNSDRQHAINFGKFYLQAFGAAANWVQVKDAFEHWNISADNAFRKGSDGKSRGNDRSDGLSADTVERATRVLERAVNFVKPEREGGKSD